MSPQNQEVSITYPATYTRYVRKASLLLREAREPVLSILQSKDALPTLVNNKKKKEKKDD